MVNTGNTIPELLERLSAVSRDFANVARKVARVGLKEHIEGDLLSWESTSFGWRS